MNEKGDITTVLIEIKKDYKKILLKTVWQKIW